MISFIRRHHIVFCPVLLLSLLTACEKDKQTETNTRPSNAAGSPTVSSKSGPGNSPAGVGQVAGRVPSTFRFEKLLQTIGTKMAPDMVAQIEKDGQSQPEMNGLMGEGWKTYMLGLREDGALVIHMEGDHLNIFGYAYKEGDTQGDRSAEAPFLKDFQQTGTIKAEVLDATFNTVTMNVKKYTHNTQNNVQAVSYTHGGNHTLAFFDSTRVHVSKMLPAPPNAMGKETVEEMKALIKAREKTKP